MVEVLRRVGWCDECRFRECFLMWFVSGTSLMDHITGKETKWLYSLA